MSHSMTKPTGSPVQISKTQISLGVCPVDQSSLCADWDAKDPRFFHPDSKDSDQTGRIPRLIGVTAVHTDHFVVPRLI